MLLAMYSHYVLKSGVIIMNFIVNLFFHLVSVGMHCENNFGRMIRL